MLSRFIKKIGAGRKTPESSSGGVAPDLSDNEKVNVNPSYTRVVEEYVGEANKRIQGEDIRRLAGSALLDSWGHRGLGEGAVYDGFFLREQRDWRDLIISPLGLLKKSGIMTMEFETEVGPIPLWVHTSQEVLRDMGALSNRDDLEYKYLSFATPSTSQVDGGARHPVARELSQMLKCRQPGGTGMIYPRLRGVERYRLGPSGYEVTSNTYRVDKNLLAMVSAGSVAIREPIIEDWDKLSHLPYVLQLITGEAVGTGSYHNKHIGDHLITSAIPT